MAAIVKTVGGLALASVKTVNALAAASLKTINGQDATAGGGSFPQGNTYNEDFRTGYQTATGTTSSGTPTLNVAIPGTPPSTFPTVCQQSNCTAATKYSVNDLGSNQTTNRKVRFWIYIASHSLADGASTYLYSGESSIGDTWARVRIRNNAGQLEVGAVGSSFSTAINVSTGTWYRVALDVTANTSGTNTIKLFDKDAAQVGSTQTFDNAAGNLRTQAFGVYSTAVTINAYIAGAGLDTTTVLAP